MLAHERQAERVRYCANCGAQLLPAWSFCGVCSAAIGPPAGPTAPPLPEAHPSETRGGLPWVVWTLAAVLLVSCVGGGAYLYQQVRQDRDSARDQLSSTREELLATNTELDSTRTSLTGTTEQLVSVKATLATKEADLRASQRQLRGVQGTLDDAESRLDLQSNQIATLKSCLNGVTDAMNYAAYNDYGAAIAALDAVQVSCERAYALF